MKLRETQMQVFRQQGLGQFVDQMVAHLRKAFPRQTKRRSEGDFRADIKEGIDDATRYEIFSRYDVQQFLECRVELGADFDRKHAGAREILRDRELTATEKMDALSDLRLFGGAKE